jgi:AraC-like DNA-binding protein
MGEKKRRRDGPSAKFRPVRFTWIQLVVPMVLASMALSLILYQQFERMSLDMLERTNRDMINQSDFIVNYINDIIYSSGIQLFYDDTIEILRTSSDIENADIVKGVRKLDTFGGYSSAIQSVYIYNGKLDKFFTTSNVPGASADKFFDQGVLELLDQVFPTSRMRPVYRYVPKPYSRGLVQVNTYLLFEENTEGLFDNAMIVNVHANWLDTVLSSFFEESEVLVLNDQGRVIGKTFGITPQQQQGVERLIRTKTSETGRFIVSNDTGKDLYLYDALGTTGWCFVRHIDWSELFAELDMMKAYTYIGIFGVLALAFLLSLRNSFRFFAPLKQISEALQKSDLSAESLPVVDYVDKLVATSNTALTVEKNYLRHLRTEYLRQLLDRTGEEYEQLRLEFAMYEVPFNLDDSFSLVLLSSNKESLLNELGGVADICFPVQMKSTSICFLQGEVDCRLLEDICVRHECHCSLGEPVEWTDDIRHSFERIKENMSYYMFPTCRSYVYRENMLDLKYPSLPDKLNLEHQIVSALSQAKLEEALALYAEYWNFVGLCRFSYIVFSMKRLYLASIGPTDTVDESLLEHLDYVLRERQDREMVDSMFKEVFEHRVEGILKSKESRAGFLVDAVRSIIERDHCDTNLSIKSIADELSLSSVYLGKVYRTHAGKSVSDEINACRLEHAMRLLEESDLPVRVIATQAGFPNCQYFFTLFRNAMNQTPGQWRDHVQKKRQERLEGIRHET